MSGNKKTPAGDAGDFGMGQAGEMSAVVNFNYITQKSPLQVEKELDLALWYFELCDGLTGPAYLAVFSLALQHIESAWGMK